MSTRKYTIVVLIGCITVLLLLVSGLPNSGLDHTGSSARTPSVPMYPAENLSTTVQTPNGMIIIEAYVPESYQVMPVYRLDMSGRRTINVNRFSLANISHEQRTAPATPAISSQDEKQAGVIAGKYLQPFHGLPVDAVLWKVEDMGNTWWVLPSMGYPSPTTLEHTQISYIRSINGQKVDNWGITEELEYTTHGLGGGNVDHDFIKVGLREDGDLLYITERWTPSEYVHDEPVISVSQALDRLRKWENTKEDYGDIPDLKVRTIRQGYFEDTGVTSIIEPAWFFSGISKNGHNQTVVVLSRKNGSELLPLYSESHPDPSIPDWKVERINYENWIKENYVNGTISIENATDIVKKFSGNSHLVIENTSEFYDDPACSGKYYVFPRTPLYDITTNEGIYIVDSRISVVRSVTYPQNLSHIRRTSLEYPELVDVSAGYIREKFGDSDVDHFSRNPDITEYPDKFSVRVLVADFYVILEIDKKTGDVISYTNANALPWTIC